MGRFDPPNLVFRQPGELAFQGALTERSVMLTEKGQHQVQPPLAHSSKGRDTVSDTIAADVITAILAIAVLKPLRARMTAAPV